MRTFFSAAGTAALCFCTSVFFSCNKEVAASAVQNTASSSATANVDAADGTVVTAYLLPTDDAFVEVRSGDPKTANTNFGSATELTMAVWGAGETYYKTRGYIKFDIFNNVPAGAKILSAKIKLFGLPPFGSNVVLQGNSVYPGSPYNSYPDNSCIISKVTSHDWTQNTITWNNKPTCSTVIGDTIPSSTSQWNYDALVDVTRQVKSMISENKNYGFCIQLHEEGLYRALEFSASETGDDDGYAIPRLIIKYKQ